MSDRLYDLLPAIYRLRDAAQGEPLRALLGILEEQLDQLEQDTLTLYDDWFIETCEEWVVPYIGDLLGVRPLQEIPSGGLPSQRALVANTLRYRRRKGTLHVIEDLARTVTGWGARAVAFYELVGWTQHLDHLRREPAANPHPLDPRLLHPHAMDRVGTVNLRSLDVVDRLDGPFDVTAHTVDIRPLAGRHGWHNLRNLGIFVWRLQSYPLRGVAARRSRDYADGFHASPLGNPQPLFTNPERAAGDEGLAVETSVPAPIRPVAFHADPAPYYGLRSDHSLAVFRGALAEESALVPVTEILCKDLSEWAPPPPGQVAVDVRRGRLAFAPGEAPADGVTVHYHQGFAADLGGGPYDRRLALETAASDDFAVTVAEVAPDPPPAHWSPTVAGALAAWDPAVQPRAVVTIADSRTYTETLSLALAAGTHLVIQAADRERPTLRLVDGAGLPSVLALGGGAGETASLTLGGLWIEGAVTVAARSLGKLALAHTTLVPGRALDEAGRPVAPTAASLDVAADNPDLVVELSACITGPLRLPESIASLALDDCIVDAPEAAGEPPPPQVAIAATDDGETPGPPCTIVRTTVFGEVHVRELTLATCSLFTGAVRARRRQTGCVRYSYVDDLVSITPRRYRCQPDLALAERRRQLKVDELAAADADAIRARLRPVFTSDRYGEPAYAMLHPGCAEEIRTGAETQAEMGVYESLRQPQREANLRERLDEYLPYGLRAGVIRVT